MTPQPPQVTVTSTIVIHVPISATQSESEKFADTLTRYVDDGYTIEEVEHLIGLKLRLVRVS